MSVRISQLHKTEAEWLAFGDWIPQAGELVVYDPDDACKYSRLKIGDGNTVLNELPFFGKQTNIVSNTIDAGRI